MRQNIVWLLACSIISVFVFQIKADTSLQVEKISLETVRLNLQEIFAKPVTLDEDWDDIFFNVLMPEDIPLDQLKEIYFNALSLSGFTIMPSADDRWLRIRSMHCAVSGHDHRYNGNIFLVVKIDPEYQQEAMFFLKESLPKFTPIEFIKNSDYLFVADQKPWIEKAILVLEGILGDKLNQ